MLPSSFINSLKGLPGFDEQAFIRVHEQQEPITSLRFNTRKTGDKKPNHFFEQANPIPWCKNGFYLKERPLFVLDPYWHAGVYYVQEASSMFLHYVLEQMVPQKNEWQVLDLCAEIGRAHF